MGYLDYSTSKASLTEPRVLPSPLESKACGLKVGRIDIWPPGCLDGVRVRSLILESGFDIAVLRCAAQDVEMGTALQGPGLVVLQADTLLYFESDARIFADEYQGFLDELQTKDEPEARTLVAEVFRDYRNHWAANPLFSPISVSSAYQDWTVRSLNKDGQSVFRFVSNDGCPLGICLLDEREDSLTEILLAGILPADRGRGVYQEMIKAVLSRAQSLGREKVAISTQASNLKALRAWCRLGMLPTVALNTFHVSVDR